MTRAPAIRMAIIDYGLGNLYSVRQACAQVGLDPVLTSCPEELATASAIILPGVGAFGDAIQALHRLDLVAPLKDLAAAGKPLVGICLGLQLLMTESHEFGRHPGLNLIAGSVLKFEQPRGSDRILKVPQVGWNAIRRPPGSGIGADPWAGTPLAPLADAEPMYFVHSFYAQPEQPDTVLCQSTYGHITFASGLKKGNVYGFQFHPERSGPAGLALYRNLLTGIAQL